MLSGNATLVHALHQQAERHPDRPALWTRGPSGLLATTWREYVGEVRRFALGLLRLGLRPGERVGLVTGNRKEWLVGYLGTLAAGAIPVGLGPLEPPEQLEYVLAHAGCRAVLVEGTRCALWLEEAKGRLPLLEHVICLEAQGALTYLQFLGGGRGEGDVAYWERVNRLDPGAAAALIYTAGTTGRPKGVLLSHHNLTWTAGRLAQQAGLGPRDVVLSHLPLSHVGEQLASLHCAVLTGMQVWFSSPAETLVEALRAVRPTVFFGVPRTWEQLRALAEEVMAQDAPPRRAAVHWARAVTSRRQLRILSRERVRYRLEAQYQLARRTLINELRSELGLDRSRIAFTYGAAIGREVLEFFLSLDLVVLELYGEAEATGPIAVNIGDDVKLGTLGRPLLGVELRIADDGEIRVRGPNVALGYHGEPEASGVLLEDGWLHTGDLGELDGDGYLRLVGRKREILVPSSGRPVGPGPIEALLRTLPPICDAVVVGDGRPYLAALLTLEERRAAELARERGWPEQPGELSSHPVFLAELDRALKELVNSQLPEEAAIRRFHVLPRRLSVEEGELTSSHQLRREAIALRHREAIEGLYPPEAR